MKDWTRLPPGPKRAKRSASKSSSIWGPQAADAVAREPLRAGEVGHEADEVGQVTDHLLEVGREGAHRPVVAADRRQRAGDRPDQALWLQRRQVDVALDAREAQGEDHRADGRDGLVGLG